MYMENDSDDFRRVLFHDCCTWKWIVLLQMFIHEWVSYWNYFNKDHKWPSNVVIHCVLIPFRIFQTNTKNWWFWSALLPLLTFAWQHLFVLLAAWYHIHLNNKPSKSNLKKWFVSWWCKQMLYIVDIKNACTIFIINPMCWSCSQPYRWLCLFVVNSDSV